MFSAPTRTGIKRLSTLSAIATMAAIFCIALIFYEGEKSNTFWMRLAWIEFLAGLVLVFNSTYLTSIIFGTNKGEGGATPAVGVILYFYVFASAALVIGTSFLPENSYISRFHLIAQILLAVTLILTYTLIDFSLAGALSGSEVPEDVISPKSLVLKLTEAEKLLSLPAMGIKSRTILPIVKNLNEKIKYSLPHAGKALSSSEYKSFAEEVNEVYLIIQTSYENVDNVDNEVDSRLSRKLNSLTIKVESIK